MRRVFFATRLSTRRVRREDRACPVGGPGDGNTVRCHVRPLAAWWLLAPTGVDQLPRIRNANDITCEDPMDLRRLHRVRAAPFMLLLVMASGGASHLSAQSSAGAGSAIGALRLGWGEVSGWVTQAAAMVPAERYGYRPVDSVRTFGQLVGHVADSYAYYCGRAAGREVEWTDPVEKGPQDKATLVRALATATAACAAVYEATPAGLGPALGNIAHTNLHYGNMITYLRMLGLVPPSS
jgi:hypothetical protein